VPLGKGRFADREEPDKTFDFGADSAASFALGASSSKDRDAAESEGAEAGTARDTSEETGWLTLRMSSQPGFVLTGGRATGP
jgi:hypothetical protein